MDAFAFIDAKKAGELQPIYVLAGDEWFLKRLALERIEALVLGEKAEDMGRSVFEGESATLAEVLDELQTLPFFGSRRLVIVREADGFVSAHRDKLEKYVASPSSVGVLVLEVKSWKSNTRLAKAIPDAATIKCEAPAAYRLPGWCVKWTASRYGKQLHESAAALLVEFIGAELGVLDQELAKLSTYVGEQSQISTAEVDKLVAHGRVQTAWQMLDAVAEGKQADALETLQHLLDQGEEPIAILGAMSWQLRRLAQVARLNRQGVSLSSAMSRAAIPPFAQKRIEPQLRQLGPRALEIYDWLLEADLGMKGSSQLPPRVILERLLIKLGER